MIPLMGVCYMMQYIDKLALSQAALLGLRKDLVRHPFELANNADNSACRISKVTSIHGRLPSSTLGIWFGVGPVPT
jgi:hypothetical protein